MYDSFDITWNANHVISKLKWKTTILSGNPVKKLYIRPITSILRPRNIDIIVHHDGRSCNIETTTSYQPILAVTDPPTQTKTRQRKDDYDIRSSTPPPPPSRPWRRGGWWCFRIHRASHHHSIELIPIYLVGVGVVDNICLFNSKELGGSFSQNDSLLLLLYHMQGLRFIHTLQRKLWQINIC